MGIFTTHASGTNDPPEVRNWRIHLIALVASMSALASMSPFTPEPRFYPFSKHHPFTVGYDSAVIGGTMALDSFNRDFGLANATQNERDTHQSNIVSVFYVSSSAFCLKLR